MFDENRNDKPDFLVANHRCRHRTKPNPVPADPGVTLRRVVPRILPGNPNPIPLEDPEEVYDEDRLVRLVRLIKIIEWLVEGLTPIERRTCWLIFIERLSIARIAELEGRTRTAIYKRLESMIKKNRFCRESSEKGRLRRRRNQYE